MKPCVNAGREGWAPPLLSDGTHQPPATVCSHIPASCILLTNIPRQFKQELCVGDAWQGVWPGHVPSLGWGHGQCQRVVPMARPLAAGMLWPGSVQAALGLIPASPQSSRSWANGHPCPVLGCSLLQGSPCVYVGNLG